MAMNSYQNQCNSDVYAEIKLNKYNKHSEKKKIAKDNYRY